MWETAIKVDRELRETAIKAEREARETSLGEARVEVAQVRAEYAKGLLDLGFYGDFDKWREAVQGDKRP